MRSALKKLCVERPVPTNAVIVFCMAWLAFPAIVTPPYGHTGFGWSDILAPLIAIALFELLSKYSAYNETISCDSGLAFDKRKIWLCVDRTSSSEIVFHIADLNVISRWWCRFFPEDFHCRLLKKARVFQWLFNVEAKLVKIPETVLEIITSPRPDDRATILVENLLFSLKLSEVNKYVVGDSEVILHFCRKTNHCKKTQS